MIAWLRNLPIYQEPAHLTAPTRRSHPAPGRPNPGAIAQIASPNGHRHRHSRRATPHRDLVDWEKEFNAQINKIRSVIEQIIANFKTWRIMHTDYRRPLATFSTTIAAVVGLHFYRAA